MANPQRYHTRDHEESQQRKSLDWIWNGLGFLFVVVMGVVGFAGAGWFIGENSINRWVAIPAELAWPASSPFLGVKLAVAFLALLLGGALFTVLYGLVEPVQPGKYDAPPPSSQSRKSRR